MKRRKTRIVTQGGREARAVGLPYLGGGRRANQSQRRKTGEGAKTKTVQLENLGLRAQTRTSARSSSAAGATTPLSHLCPALLPALALVR